MKIETVSEFQVQTDVQQTIGKLVSCTNKRNKHIMSLYASQNYTAQWNIRLLLISNSMRLAALTARAL